MNADLGGRWADGAEPLLAAMGAGLQRLESGLDPDLIAELIRDAHTISGVAAAGDDELGAVARHVEILLQEVGGGHRPASAALVDTLLHTVAGLRTAIGRIRAGGDASELARAQHAALDAFGVLPAASSSPAPCPAPAPARAAAPTPAPAPAPAPAVRCLLVEAGQRAYAIPMDAVTTAVDGRGEVWLDGAPVEIVGLGEALDPNTSATPPAVGPVMVVRGVDRSCGFRVDAVLGPRDVVVKGLPALLPPMSMVSGAGIEPDGSVLCVLNAPGVVERAQAMIQR